MELVKPQIKKRIYHYQNSGDTLLLKILQSEVLETEMRLARKGLLQEESVLHLITYSIKQNYTKYKFHEMIFFCLNHHSLVSDLSHRSHIASGHK